MSKAPTAHPANPQQFLYPRAGEVWEPGLEWNVPAPELDLPSPKPSAFKERRPMDLFVSENTTLSFKPGQHSPIRMNRNGY